MRNSKWSFPYPILTKGRNDYSSGSFSLVEGEHSTDNSHFTFHFSYNLECSGLAQYIADGHADIMLFVESSLTRYRNRFYFDKTTHVAEAKIIKDDLAGRVSFTAYIIAYGDPEFKLPEFNQDYYQDVSFDIRKGDILAESETISIPIDDTELLKPVSSIFNIGQTAIEEQGVQVQYDDHKIQIRLPQETYKQYDGLRRKYPQLRRALSAIITLPALVEAIDMIDDEDFAECRWNLSLRKKGSDNGINFNEEDNTFRNANHVYGNIVSDAIAAIKNVMETLDNHDEEGGLY